MDTNNMGHRHRHTMAHITAAGWGMLRDCFLHRHIMEMEAVARLVDWVGCWVGARLRIMVTIAIMDIMGMDTTTTVVGNW